jgi:hypothetical protein
MKIITELRAASETILDEDLNRISPMMHQHVIPNGTYHFARSPGTTLRESGRLRKAQVRHKYHAHQEVNIGA